MDSLIGVRQGSIEGPPLFIFIMQAALETMEWPVDKPTFCTRADEKGEMNGVRPGTKRGVERFNIWASLFADDCACLFNTRADLVTGANYMYHHFRRFGLSFMWALRVPSPKRRQCTYQPGATRRSPVILPTLSWAQGMLTLRTSSSILVASFRVI